MIFLSFLSGVSALVYQAAWFRLLGLTIGTAATAMALLLTAFFLGLAMGSLLAQRLLNSGVSALRGFAVAEMVTALSALLLLPLLFNLDQLLVLFPWAGAYPLTRFFLSFISLMIPSIAIGATFPLLAAWFATTGRRTGEQLGTLYAINTLGAMAGALLGGFLLIPAIGLDGAIYSAVALNALIAITSFVIARRQAISPMVRPADESTSIGSRALLLALAVTGFTSISAEVVWTRYLSIYSGTTLYGYSATMAVLLLGIALGSWGARSWRRRFQSHPLQIVMLLMLSGAVLIATRSLLAMWPSMTGDSIALGEVLRTPFIFTAMALTLLPASACFGALLPLVLESYCGDGSGIRHHLGMAYALNTLACVAGAVVTSMWLLPLLGSDLTLGLIALLPLVAAWILLHTVSDRSHRKLATISLFVLAGLTMVLPGVDYREVFSSARYRYSGVAEEKQPSFHYLAEGRSGVISVVDYGDNALYLQKNGIKEAVLDKTDARKGSLAEALLGVLPYLLQEQAHNAFVIGFGGGTTTRMLAESGLGSIAVAEIEPRVIEAVTQIDPGNFSFLHNGQVTIDYNDARNSLLVNNTRYSIIVSQPSHTWLAGSANLYSREFFALVHSRLKPGGVFGQWVNLFHMDAKTLRSILKTFYEEFPRGAVFGVMAGSDLLLMGSDTPLILDFDRTRRLFENANIKVTMTHGGLTDFNTLPTFFLFTRDEALAIAGDAPLCRDSNLLVEVRLAALNGKTINEDDPYKLLQPYIRQDIGAYIVRDD